MAQSFVIYKKSLLRSKITIINLRQTIIEILEEPKKCLQTGIALRLAQEHAIGQELESRLVREFLVEANAIADLVAQVLLSLIGNSFCHGDGGDSTGLGNGDLAIY